MKRRTDICTDLYAETIKAIEAGDTEKAKETLAQYAEEARFVHDGFAETIASLLTWIAEKNGEEAVEEAYRHLAEDFWKPMLMSMKDAGAEAFLKVFIGAARAHASDFYIEEDDEKYAVVSTYCGTGGKMIKEGKVDTSDRHPFNYGTTKKPHDWSFGKAGIPYYCAHCSLWMDKQPKEWGINLFEHRFGRQFDEEGNPVDEPCKTFIYKKPA